MQKLSQSPVVQSSVTLPTNIASPPLGRQTVLGMPVHLPSEPVNWLLQRQAQGQGSHVITLNSEMVMLARETPELATVIKQAELVVPDGAGIVLYFRLYGRKIQRCPGIELAESLLKAAATTSPPLKVFFYGGNPEVMADNAHRWQQQLPGLSIVGAYHGYQSPETEMDVCADLAELQPQVIFVGLGVPRQEYWISHHRHLCPNAIWVGVGGSFDVWGGVKSRAPLWLRENNLEWVYRLYQEPWRWRRMLALPHFAWRALLSRITNPNAVSSR
jgi:N-acetylglucosaminyldiphosphoundecaprenol N-acetyl-beta-D-mannosaminyltransferase